MRPKPKETWADLISAYLASAKYRKLAQGTKPDYDRVMDAILEKNATKPVRNMTRAAVLAIHAKYGDTPARRSLYSDDPPADELRS